MKAQREMKTRNKRAKREGQIDGTSGRLDRIEEKEERKKLLFTLHGSRRLRGLVPSTSRQEEDREDREKTKGKAEGRKNRTNRVSHGESKINRKETAIMLFRIRYKIDIKHSEA